MFAPAHSSPSSCSHPPLLTLTSYSLTTLSRPTSPSTLPSVNPMLRSHERRTMALWPKHLLSQIMSPTWRSHFWRFWGYCFVLPVLECRDSQRPWRQQCGVSRCWDWRRAHQKCACFVTVYTGERSWSQSDANLSLQWRRFVSRFTVIFSKHEATRRLVDTKTRVLPRVSWRSDQDQFGLRKWKKLLAGAESEILRHDSRADLAENNIDVLNRQIESQALEIGQTIAGYEKSRREQDPLH